MASAHNRRRFHRFPFDSQAHLTLNDTSRLSCALVDVSINGALLALDASQEPLGGRRGHLELIMRGLVRGDRVEIRGQVEVVWKEANHLGCRFIAVDAESFAHLKVLVEDNLGDPRLLDRELTQLGYWPGVESAAGA